MSDRRAVLERMGRGYAREGLAVVWTVTNTGGGDDMKEVRGAAWQTTRPLANGDWAAGTFKERGKTHNPGVTARTSNLIVFDVDTEEGLAEIARLGLPATWTVQSSAPYKRHFWFRPPADAEKVPVVGFRFEAAGLTGDSNRYLVCPPAIHPSGVEYRFAVGGPDSTMPIAELPLHVYDALLQRAAKSEKRTRATVENGDEKILAGQRRSTVFKHACMQRRWGLSESAIADACMAFNLERCIPPLTRDQVDHQVHGAMAYPGGDELRTTATKQTARAKPSVAGGPSSMLDFVRIADVTMRSVEWLERPLWQGRTFTVLAGAKGAGKGTYTALVGAKVTRGALHDGAPKNVVFVSSEDSAAIDIKPRLVAAGADVNRCILITDTFRLPDDLDRLRAVIAEIGDVAMVVIDPVSNHIGDRNSNAEGEVRDAIAPLNHLADDLGCLIIGVRHVGKNRTSGAISAILGSTAWVDTPRAVVMIAADPDDAAIRHVQVVAGNRSPSRGGIKFRIEGATVDGLTEEVSVAVELGVSERDIDDLFAPDVNTPAASKTSKARDVLLDLLESEQAIASGIESDALDADVANRVGLKAKTIRNVRGVLSDEGLIKSRPELDENGNPARWIVYRTGAARR